MEEIFAEIVQHLITIEQTEPSSFEYKEALSKAIDGVCALIRLLRIRLASFLSVELPRQNPGKLPLSQIAHRTELFESFRSVQDFLAFTELLRQVLEARGCGHRFIEDYIAELNRNFLTMFEESMDSDYFNETLDELQKLFCENGGIRIKRPDRPRPPTDLKKLIVEVILFTLEVSGPLLNARIEKFEKAHEPHPAPEVQPFKLKLLTVLYAAAKRRWLEGEGLIGQRKPTARGGPGESHVTRSPASQRRKSKKRELQANARVPA